MNALLTAIVSRKQEEIALLQQEQSLMSYSNLPLFSRNTISLRQSLQQNGFGIIAEIKRKSPGAGDIKPDIDIKSQVKSYCQAGASGISILTDYTYFGGSTDDLLMVRQSCELPVLRKEFILHELQLFQAKANGADAVLLIASILEKQQAHHLTIIAKSLGMEVVFEIHTLQELEKLNDEVDLLLVNNRNLDTLVTNVHHCLELSRHLPSFLPAIAASGIKTIDEIERIREAGYTGALIGESILKNDHLNQLTLTTCKD